jgi:hypothetical protein
MASGNLAGCFWPTYENVAGERPSPFSASENNESQGVVPDVPSTGDERDLPALGSAARAGDAACTGIWWRPRPRRGLQVGGIAPESCRPCWGRLGNLRNDAIQDRNAERPKSPRQTVVRFLPSWTRRHGGAVFLGTAYHPLSRHLEWPARPCRNWCHRTAVSITATRSIWSLYCL